MDNKENEINHQDPEFTLYKLLNIEKTATGAEISKPSISFLRESLLKDQLEGSSR